MRQHLNTVEGPEALENFEQFARAILQAPKPKGKTKAQPCQAVPYPAKSLIPRNRLWGIPAANTTLVIELAQQEVQRKLISHLPIKSSSL
jgi:hypothetical protein